MAHGTRKSLYRKQKKEKLWSERAIPEGQERSWTAVGCWGVPPHNLDLYMTFIWPSSAVYRETENVVYICISFQALGVEYRCLSPKEGGTQHVGGGLKSLPSQLGHTDHTTQAATLRWWSWRHRKEKDKAERSDWATNPSLTHSSPIPVSATVGKLQFGLFLIWQGYMQLTRLQWCLTHGRKAMLLLHKDTHILRDWGLTWPSGKVWDRVSKDSCSDVSEQNTYPKFLHPQMSILIPIHSGLKSAL